MELLDDRKTIGAAAERAVRRHLESKGYVYRTSNWRHMRGEIDLVMMEGEELVFVEVKARRSEIAGRAEEGVSKKQAGVLLRTAEMYSLTHPDVEGKFWRIDLVGVTLAPDGEILELVHYENAIVVG